jgi:virginiamycin B lyase
MKLLPLALLPLTGVAGAMLLELAPIEITEWPVPWENTRPRDPFVDGQGRVWFVGQTGHYAAYMDPRSGEFRRFDMEDGAGPHNLIVDEAGTVWYAGNRGGYIGKLDPATGEIHRIRMPDEAARDPHTLVFDRNGDIWFTVQQGNFVGKLTRTTEEVRLIRVPTERARPYGIRIDAQNRPWFNEFGTNKIGTVDPATMELREYTLPAADARGRRIEVTSDGGVWYVDYARGSLGRLDPASGEVREWESPGGSESRPYAMALDDQERIWYVETGASPNRMVGFDPGTGEFFSVTEIESGAGAVRHMVYHAPSREIWFGTDANTLGRARVP